MDDFQRRQHVVDLHLDERYEFCAVVPVRGGEGAGIGCTACGFRELRPGKRFRIYQSHESLARLAEDVSDGTRLIEPPLSFEAIIALCEACQAFAPALSLVAAYGGRLAEEALRNFAGSALTVRLGCPRGCTSNPSFSITLTNRGSQTVRVPRFPISLVVQLEITDKQGTSITAARVESGTPRSMASYGLAPGDSVLLDHWPPGQHGDPPLLPLSLFGYRLTRGAYSVCARISERPGATQSNVCSIEIP